MNMINHYGFGNIASKSTEFRFKILLTALELHTHTHIEREINRILLAKQDFREENAKMSV